MHTGIVQHGILNVPALFILLILSLLLIKGTQESAIVNSVIVIIKVSIVLLFIAIGWQFINPANHSPYMIPADAKPALLPDGTEYTYTNFFRHGWGGVLRGAAVVFFAFIGFDAVSTAAQKDMPVGILGSLVICTVLYVLFSWVLTGVAPYTDFVRAGKEASVAYAIETYMTNYHWLGKWITVGILAGFSSVILVMLLGQSRVFFSMSNDGLLPKVFSALHPKFRTPYKSNALLFLFAGSIATLLPGDITGDLTSIGTLLAFARVCVGIIIMRKADPDHPRPFRTPLVPLVPILGAGLCLAMIVSLDNTTILVALAWMVIGLMIYFGYSKANSKLKA
jgi:APA family basic amino acid/polyamine antiporter